MLELEDAVARILAALPGPQAEVVPVEAAYRRILLEEIVSPTDLPGFDNSAMDGYALRAQDVRGAKPNAPVVLRVLGRVAAGEVFPEPVTSGTCVRLFTGSPVPEGADCVVMQEDTQVVDDSSGQVRVLEAVAPGENIRLCGEDVRLGASLAKPGERLGVGHLSVLAAAGVARLTVGRQPRVGLLATGSELKEPGSALAPGQIYESNRVGLAALLHSTGAEPKVFPLVKDTPAATEQALSTGFEQCDLLVTTGGASVGELDLVRSAFEKLGGKIEFWKVALKPGRPFMFGEIGGRFLFGLPGNPVSALVSFLLLARPALLRWQGAANTDLSTELGIASEALTNPGSRRHFVRVTMESKGAVSLAGTQASHMLGSLAAANGLVDLAPNMTIPAGAQVLVRKWES